MDLNFVHASPLIKSCGFTKSDVEENITQWQTASSLILNALNFDGADLDQAAKNRVYQYYLPIVMWIQRLRKQRTEEGPLVLGISAPQGCGKSTLVECLYAVFAELGLRAASVSIDDFYLTHAEQNKVAGAHADNPLLQCRGNAMTHDLPLGTDTLKNLKSDNLCSYWAARLEVWFLALTGEGSVAIPRYDKSAFEGKGDRTAPENWKTVQGPLDLILFEGWMLGFSPVSTEAVSAVDANLIAINEALKSYVSAWDCCVDAWLVIKVADPSWVGKWRLQAEHAMKKSGKSGMSDAAVEAFVSCYMPAYKAYLPGLYSKGPSTASPNNCLIIEVDEHRSPIAQQPDPIL